jgi:hypothetical protein
MNAVVMQAQRAGKKPPDAEATFGEVWRWKKPAFENLCSTYVKELGRDHAQALHLDHYAGYFQSGSALLVYTCRKGSVHFVVSGMSARCQRKLFGFLFSDLQCVTRKATDRLLLLCTGSVIATGPAAFTVTMQALGALHFFDVLHDLRPVNTFGDPAACLSEPYKQHALSSLTLRHLRCASCPL